MNNASLSSRVAAFGLAVGITVAMLMSVANLAQVAPAQTMAVAPSTVNA